MKISDFLKQKKISKEDWEKAILMSIIDYPDTRTVFVSGYEVILVGKEIKEIKKCHGRET